MKAPSLRCLKLLRAVAFGDEAIALRCIAKRRYATNQKPTSTERRDHAPPLPLPAFKPPPQVPNFKLKELRAKNDGVEFTPTVLSRPIGLPDRPQPGDNMRLQTRTLRDWRQDFGNREKNLERRIAMMEQKPYFKDWSNMKFHKGKQFYANDRLFRAEHSLFIPNFYGLTLRKDAARENTKDGYGGRGRDSCKVMAGKITVLNVFSSQWAQEQAATFLSKESNPEIHRMLENPRNNAQLVEINREENFMKWWLLRAFAPGLRRARSLEQQSRYFMMRQGLSKTVKESIGALNDKVSYLYLVDPQLRIRWAGNARAEPREIESLNRGLRRLIDEKRAPAKEVSSSSLQDAVTSVVR